MLQKTNEAQQIKITITYPDINLPAVNLWKVVPAWYFYASKEERQRFYEELLNKDDLKGY